MKYYCRTTPVYPPSDKHNKNYQKKENITYEDNSSNFAKILSKVYEGGRYNANAENNRSNH